MVTLLILSLVRFGICSAISSINRIKRQVCGVKAALLFQGLLDVLTRDMRKVKCNEGFSREFEQLDGPLIKN